MLCSILHANIMLTTFLSMIFHLLLFSSCPQLVMFHLVLNVNCFVNVRVPPTLQCVVCLPTLGLPLFILSQTRLRPKMVSTFFCRFFLRRHQMHLIREGLEVNLIKVMGVTFLNTLAIGNIGGIGILVGWEYWWDRKDGKVKRGTKAEQ